MKDEPKDVNEPSRVATLQRPIANSGKMEIGAPGFITAWLSSGAHFRSRRMKDSLQLFDAKRHVLALSIDVYYFRPNRVAVFQ